ncbi:endonuclease [Jejuia spongiicola]|uniref:Endonuclease n=1 Tax=Jejuia spongiicola TaxID=2942207 RepID=A0ABT0Q9S2_9FLAO|nr:endonuclease [Jejuia spongiicola]MCL6293729.1 endonuclease [Jejuia spongiicola]
MKKAFLILSAIIICSCSSGGDDAPPPTQGPVEDGKPIAVNDNATTPEDTELSLSDLLDNDTVVDNAKVTSFDATTSQGGTVSDERTHYLYTPKEAFVGEDTFTYTLCDDDDPANCSTATVTITVIDEGNPVATADAYSAIENTTTVFAKLLENDDTIDDTILSSIDDTGTQGTVVLNNDKTVSYTPQNGFLGQDTFTYTICDDDSPDNSCSTATVTVTVIKPLAFNIPSELVDYYNGVVFAEDSDFMFSQMESHTKSNHTTILPYGQRHQYLYNADADLNNTDNVILMYSGESRYWEEYTSGTNSYSPQTFNTEHVYPQSLLSSDDAVTDLHHLRSCDASVNSNRLNYPFVDGSGTYTLVGEEWFPGDDWRGDIARMIMYLNIRYGETFERVGGLDLFIAWNIADPVSEFEEQRNNVIYAAQGNRNPFIDNPYLATLIWGGSDAENKWN